MPISLLALDLDGTLLDSRGLISERNRNAIDNAREQGVHVALVTGRRFRDSRPVALELGLDVPLISHNGALTKHAATLQTVCVLPLSLAAARAALQVGRNADADALLSDDHEGLGVLIYDHIRGENSAAYKYISWARRIHGTEAGGNAVQVNGISLDLEDNGKLLSTARDRAVANAKTKAEQYAKASGRDLGAVVSISETISDPPPVAYDVRAMASKDSASPVPIQPGSENVGVTVTVVYAFR